MAKATVKYPVEPVVVVEMTADEAGRLRALLNMTNGDTFTSVWEALYNLGDKIPTYEWHAGVIDVSHMSRED